jgi:hypothetical protein
MIETIDRSSVRAPARRRKVAVVIAAVVALLLGAGATTAVPQGSITIHGAQSGSHLKLSVRGSHLVVKGWMSRAKPRGCRYKRHRLLAVCRLASVGSIEVNMGPSGDMVEVLDRLPAPLTIYLGNGSDKFIGNGERDTCYPQGARRNRCIGRGGRDICITGSRNSDCVGGRGNDYCQHGTGSDGCWGGPGNDVCRMGGGHDGCHGGGGHDRLFGGGATDRLYGGRGRDHCDGEGGWGRSQGCEAGPRR